MAWNIGRIHTHGFVGTNTNLGTSTAKDSINSEIQFSGISSAEQSVFCCVRYYTKSLVFVSIVNRSTLIAEERKKKDCKTDIQLGSYALTQK